MFGINSFQIPGTNQAIWIIAGNAATGTLVSIHFPPMVTLIYFGTISSKTAVTDRSYTAQANYKAQRVRFLHLAICSFRPFHGHQTFFFQWVFETVDKDGSDLQDPNTLNFPSLLSPGTGGGGNPSEGDPVSVTEANAKAYVATLKDNGVAFRYVTSL